jgi:hypothetical protein
VFNDLRMYLKLRPLIGALKKEFCMKFSWNMVIQIVATLIQCANVISGLLPPAQQASLALIVGAVQGVVAAIAHFKNPDGTPAAEPYVKKGEIPLYELKTDRP